MHSKDYGKQTDACRIVEERLFNTVEEHRFSTWKSIASARGRASLQHVEEHRFSTWKSGASAPRKAPGINAGFSPCGRVWHSRRPFL
jgi:hypothetical protein